MSHSGIGVDRATVEGLDYAVEVLNPSDLKAAAAVLNHAAEVLPGGVPGECLAGKRIEFGGDCGEVFAGVGR